MENFEAKALLFAEIKNSNLSDATKDWIFAKVMDEINPAPVEKEKATRNTSGLYQIDKETKSVVGSYDTQKEANIALEKKEKSTGIGDALHRRVKSHFAYGYLWCYRDVWDAMTPDERAQYN